LEERIIETSISKETIKSYAGFKIVSHELVIEKITAGWDSSSDPRGNWSTLEDISLVVKPGRLIAVIGPVGCGKVDSKEQHIRTIMSHIVYDCF